MSHRALIATLVPAVVAAALLAACASPTAVPTAPAAAPTPVAATAALPGGGALATELFPFDPASIPVDPNQQPVAGTCAASALVPRQGAYACVTASGGSFDPCFAVGEGVLGCQPNPVAGTWSALVQVSGALPATTNQAASPVKFYLDLGTGYPPCRLGTSSPMQLNGLEVTYSCQAPGAWIVGPLDTANATWIAQYVTTDAAGTTITYGPTGVNVVRSWSY
jgi:hypothetical protein